MRPKSFKHSFTTVFWRRSLGQARHSLKTPSVHPSGTFTLMDRSSLHRLCHSGGVIKDDALQSTPWWPPRVVPPADAPNVLLIITDDSVSACQAPLVASYRRRRWMLWLRQD